MADSVCHAPPIFQYHCKLKFFQQKLQISQTNIFSTLSNSVLYVLSQLPTYGKTVCRGFVFHVQSMFMVIFKSMLSICDYVMF